MANKVWRVMCVSVALLWAGCSGEASSELVLGGTVNLEQMKLDAKPFETFRATAEGEELVLSGKIGKVCPAGCWFYLEGEADMTYVDVLGDFEVPQSASGRQSWVRGRVNGEGGAQILQAMRVVVEPAK